MSCCETQNLAVGYGVPLLRDIALHAERGKILALIGPNGAGKSTLLKTLAGQLAAQGGAVLLDGQDLTAYTPNARARKLALMLPHTARTELTSCWRTAILPGSATASASACCWPARSASSQRFCFWTSLRRFWM